MAFLQVRARQLRYCSWCAWSVQIDAKGGAFHFPAALVKRCGHLVCSAPWQRPSLFNSSFQANKIRVCGVWCILASFCCTSRIAEDRLPFVFSVQVPNISPLLLLTCDCWPPRLHELCMAKLMDVTGLCLLHLWWNQKLLSSLSRKSVNRTCIDLWRARQKSRVEFVRNSIHLLELALSPPPQRSPLWHERRKLENMKNKLNNTHVVPYCQCNARSFKYMTQQTRSVKVRAFETVVWLMACRMESNLSCSWLFCLWSTLSQSEASEWVESPRTIILDVYSCSLLSFVLILRDKNVVIVCNTPSGKQHFWWYLRWRKDFWKESQLYTWHIPL